MVRVLVKSFYIVFAKAMGRWLDRKVGLSFLYSRMVWLVFQEVDIVFCL